MKKFLLLCTLSFLCLGIVVAQPAGKAPKFSFSVSRVGDSLAKLTIKASLPDSLLLFGANAVKPEDFFVSKLTLDSQGHNFVSPVDTILITGKQATVQDTAYGSKTVYVDSAVFVYTLHTSKNDSSVSGAFAWLGKKGDEYQPGEERFTLSLKAGEAAANVSAAGANEIGNRSLLSLFFVCLGAGLLAVLTPCVFPLIPVTVSFFLKRSKTKAEGISNAAWYSLSIILIYTIPTILLTRLFGDTVLYRISTHPVTNILFFIIFILFGISLLGAFELTLPSKWANATDQQAGKGGKRGVFFMAITLVIVSFSCTGPIVGLLFGSTAAGGTILAPIIGIFAFALGLALPFTLFAFFPSLMQSLPKSGGWLNSVKVVFGFIELALALKFLSNVDLIYHWHLLDREVFLSIWIAIIVLLCLYLIGKLKFSHDSDLKYINIPRLFFAIAFLSFAVYLVPGLWGAPLKGLSGVIPPSTTQEFNLDELQYKIGNSPAAGSSSSTAKPPQRLTEKLHAPFQLSAYFDLKEAIAASKALNKPMMLDFTGHSCANCRKMEEQVWKNPEVLKRIKEDFVLVSLYVDEATPLPAGEQYTNARGEQITNEGEKNLDYEITKFGFNAQPLYMFIDADGKVLSDVKYGYDPDIQKFVNHLETVKAAYKK